MKYLIVATNPTTHVIEYNIIDNKGSIPSFIGLNYLALIAKCNYSWKELRRYILIFEIEPDYELLSLNITRPIEFDIKLVERYNQ